MQHDEVVWGIIGNNNFCSFKVKPRQDVKNQAFCRNPYNVSGLCSKKACPLSNSQYATVLEKEGIIYLYIKTAERSHSPKNMWEKIKLPKNYVQALQLIDQHLAFWPKFLTMKCKQRLTRIHQYLIRMRKLKLKVQPKLVGKMKKIDRREATRENKALRAAHINDSIKNELLTRLQQNTYGDIYNFPQQQYEEVLDEEEEKNMDNQESEEEYEEDVEEEFEDGDGEIEYVEEYDSDIVSGSEEGFDVEDWNMASVNDGNSEDDDINVGIDEDQELLRQARTKALQRKTSKKDSKRGAPKPKFEIEYEYEQETTNNQS